MKKEKSFLMSFLLLLIFISSHDVNDSKYIIKLKISINIWIIKIL